MELLAKNLRPRDIVTRKAFENAAMVVAATGGSTNAALHLPAMAQRGRHQVRPVRRGRNLQARRPISLDLKPGGKYVAKDMWEAGGVPMLMRHCSMAAYLHGDCMTVTGKTVAENLQGREIQSQPESDARRRTIRWRRPAAWSA